METNREKRALYDLFGEKIARAVLFSSKAFRIPVYYIIALLCAENGSSLDNDILYTVSSQLKANPDGRNHTTSPHGAKGIMQIKPKTAAYLIKKLKRRGKWPFGEISVEEALENPIINIYLATAYIREIALLKGKNFEKVVIHYHAGPNGKPNSETFKHLKKALLAKKQWNKYVDGRKN